MMFQFIILLLPVSLGFLSVGGENKITFDNPFNHELVDSPTMDSSIDFSEEALAPFIQTIEDLIADINQSSSVYLENLSNETMNQILHSSILNTRPCANSFEIDKHKESFIVELGLLEIPLREAISELKDKVSGMKRSMDIEMSASKVKQELCERSGGLCKNETVLSPYIQCVNGSCSSKEITVMFQDSLELTLNSLNQTVLQPSTSRRNLLPTECPGGLFKCQSGQCIDFSNVCNGRPNCYDYSDEGRGNCPDTCTGKRCRNLACISEEEICNGIDDCGDGTDEKNCPNLDNCGIDSERYLCYGRTKCISLKEVCDGKVDCGDGSDESNRCTDSSICKSCSLVSGSCLRTPNGPICLRKCPSDFILDLKDGTCIPRKSTFEPFIVYNSNSPFGIVDKLRILSARFSNGFILLKKNMNHNMKKTLHDLSKCVVDNNRGSLSSPFVVY